jgi:glutathione synthase
MGIKPAPGQEAASRLIITHAPFTVGAFPFPRSQFEKAVHIAPLFNVMVEKVSRNPQWLIDTLRPTACTDDFVRRLLDLYEIVLREGVKQTISLGLIRSDYMVHKKPGDSRSLLQVEINTIASSFGSLSTKIAEMHRTFAAMEGDYSRAPPENNAVTGLAEGIAAGHKAFIAQTRIDNCSCIMVVQPNERNFCDQRLL